MAKKILNVKFKMVLNNDNGDFNQVTEFKPDSAGDLLGNLRKSLNAIYGYPVDAQDPEGFQDLSLNSFKTVDVDVEE